MRRNIEGVIALPAIILMSGLILIAGLGIASSSFLENAMSYDDADSQKALAAAEAGARDAFLRLVKNKLCNQGGTPPCLAYALSFTDTTATSTAAITVTGVNPKTILSTGSVNGKIRVVQVVVAFDSNNKATQTSWREITD